MGQYNRGGGYRGSSGLEHVFLGEKDGTTISGYHSWIKYYRDESAGKVNYLGYSRIIKLGVVRHLLYPCSILKIESKLNVMFDFKEHHYRNANEMGRPLQVDRLHFRVGKSRNRVGSGHRLFLN